MASADEPTGYSHTFVGDVRDYECAICLEVAKDPVQISSCVSGHSFCQTCWTEYVNRREAEGHQLICPMDKERVHHTQVFADQRQRTEIRGLRVKCRNHDSGCEVTPELRDFETHLAKCQYQMVECPLGCGKSVLVRSVDEHRQQHCPKRLLVCQACGEQVAACYVQAHTKTCPMKMVSCDLCQRGGLLNKDIVRSELPAHHQINALQHLALVNASICTVYEDEMSGVAQGPVLGYELPAPLWGRVGQVETLSTRRNFTDLKATNDALTYEIEQLKETNIELRNEIVNNKHTHDQKMREYNQKIQDQDQKMQDQDRKIQVLEVANQQFAKLCEDMGKKMDKFEKGMKGETSGSEGKGGAVQVGACGGGSGVGGVGGQVLGVSGGKGGVVQSTGGVGGSGGVDVGGVVRPMEILEGVRITCPCFWRVKLTGHMEVYSPPFYTQDGYKMCLRVLCGWSGLSVFCYLMAGERGGELRWPWAGEERMTVREAGSGRELVGEQCGVEEVGHHDRDRPQGGRNDGFLFYNRRIPYPGDGVMIEITIT